MGKRVSAKVVQLALFRHGGARPGAGRKRISDRALVPHRPRARVTPHAPVLVTTRLCARLPNLRTEPILAILRRAFAAGADHPGFRLVEFSVQSNHMHLVVEAADARALARGMRGLHVRIARALNQVWIRRGAVFVGRYHARVLRTPREVRHALVYVLQNARKHGEQLTGVDPFSSGPWFEGWIDQAARAPHQLPRAKSWLLAVGWMRHGRIASSESPAG